MTALLDALESIGAASVSLLWLPLAAWTLVWLAAEAGLRAGRTVHPAVRYRGAQAVLLALPVGIVLAALVDLIGFARLPVVPVLPDLGMVMLPEVVGVEGDDVPAPLAPGPAFSIAAALGLAVCVAGALAAFRLVRLGADALALGRLRRRLRRFARPQPALEREAVELARRLGVRRPVEVVVSEVEAVPMTFGLRRPLLVLPAGLSAEDRRLALAHELAHVRQYDFAGQWMEALVAAVFAVHPAVHRLRQQCALLREMACDAALLAEAGVGRGAYARLLFACAAPPAAPRPAVVSMADSPSHLHQRLHAMKDVSSSLRSPRFVGTVALLVLVVGSLTLTATQTIAHTTPEPLSAGLTSAAAPSLSTPTAAGDTTVYVIVEQMPEIVGGMEALQQRVRYPELARRAGIEGTVFVQFVVDERGQVFDVACVRDPGAGTCEAALEAVRATEFTPGRQHGEAVKVRFSLPIRFRLPEGAAPKRPTQGQLVDVAITETSVQDRQLVVRGTARLAETGEAVAGATVRLGAFYTPQGTREPGEIASTESGPDGRFLLRAPYSDQWSTLVVAASDDERQLVGVAPILPSAFRP